MGSLFSYCKKIKLSDTSCLIAWSDQRSRLRAWHWKMDMSWRLTKIHFFKSLPMSRASLTLMAEVMS